ncbi:MAG TPA: M12 family metallopeptidase [Cellvibrio sp.]|nr:M12 family metallopeptidase [Cellvibrio sp.]
MCSEPYFCTELEFPDKALSLKAALEENPDNINHSFSNQTMRAALAVAPAPYIALVFQKKWKAGRTLKIAFMGLVDPTVKNKIISYAKLWLDFINLKFDFVDGENGDIRISTTPGGSWSYIGTDATLIAPGKPTMNYGWLLPDTKDDEYSRVVLHEFGHALGAIHEHQHPAAGIPWDRPKVYEYYARQGWSKDQVDNNLFKKYNSDQLNTSSYDRASIIHYAVPNELTVGDWEIPWNTALSETDKIFMKEQYS